MPYTIHQDKDEYLESVRALGEIDYMTQQIYIKSNMSDDRKLKVLMHEVAHGVFFELGALKVAADESIVTYAGICLLAVIKANTFDWVKNC
jgi:Zn-dependent peptidase ImmA (M78 family)